LYLSSDQQLVPYKPRPGILKRLKSVLCRVILYGTLILIGLIAIPACALLALISLIWSLSDGLLRRLDHWENSRP